MRCFQMIQENTIQSVVMGYNFDEMTSSQNVGIIDSGFTVADVYAHVRLR